MPHSTPAPDTHYWYGGEDDRDDRAVDVLQAFRLYRAADAAMRRRTRDSMSMGENEMLVLRYLLRAQHEQRGVSPSEIARYLGVSTASTTAIVDRLEASGHVVREAHPTDRRRIHVIATERTDEEVRETLGAMHTRMLAAVVGMTAEESRIVVDCLTRLRDAIDHVEAVAPGRA